MRKSLKVCTLALAVTLGLSSVGCSESGPAPDTQAANYQAKGEQDKSYVFPGTDESIAYHIYVPQKWDGNTQLPLVILTHGASQPSTAPFQRPMQNPTLAKMAEERGYIVAAVTGYHANATGVGGWNVPYPMVQVPRPPRPAGAAPGGGGPGGARANGGTPPPPPTAEDFERAEQDIVNVRNLMLEEYNADPQRVYLMGNSSGGSAVWNLAAKQPELWTAISPSAAPLEDADFPYEDLKTMPVLVVHGDMDTTMAFEGSKAMVDHAKAAGVDATWLPVIGGAHTDAWAQPEILSQTFDFFDAHNTK
jgi:poly(3-hydroxybutyrate) depolymerase